MEEIQRSGIKFGLDNVLTVLRSFGDPHKKFPSIHVAGTNGKGSVCAMLTEVLSRHGLRVGFYSSPHLVRVEERVRVGRNLISSRAFCRMLTELKNGVEGLVRAGKLPSPLTYFEHLTCLAFLFFEREKVDIAVLEVGMGGRFDATNVVTPLVSVITSISRDHMEFLGRTSADIAGEKAGIIKPGVPVVCGIRMGRVYRVIRSSAKEMGSPFVGVFNKDKEFKATKTRSGYHFIYKIGGQTYRFRPGLQGRYQGENAAVAIAAAHEMNRVWRGLSKRNIIQGLTQTRWEGRLETLSRNPDIILDGAHNEGAARELRAYIREFLRPPLILVFAVLKDKDIRALTRILFPLADRIILTGLPFARAARPDEVKALAPTPAGRIIIEPDLRQAMHAAGEAAGKRGTVLVAGSLFLVGEVKKLSRAGLLF